MGKYTKKQFSANLIQIFVGIQRVKIVDRYLKFSSNTYIKNQVLQVMRFSNDSVGARQTFFIFVKCWLICGLLPPHTNFNLFFYNRISFSPDNEDIKIFEQKKFISKLYLNVLKTHLILIKSTRYITVLCSHP